MIRGVIFDLDGVLVSTDEFHFEAWKRLAEEENIPFDRAVNQRQRGIGRMESLDVLLEKSTRGYSQAEKLALAERKNSYYRELLQTLTPDDTLPGARAMLAALHERGVRTAIGSASRNAPVILERVTLTDAVDIVVDGRDLTLSKPHPECFLLCAERLGLPPGDCLVVEDAEAGVEAALAAGMAVVGIGSAERLPKAPRAVRNLAAIEVEELLMADTPG
ncbi:MAG: beta-phosphoglucomutase [Lentisphaerae bacterium]|nr:beta-phosphoglucomutase [Lentisphaerota bacterium]